MKAEFTCTYCNKQWSEVIWNTDFVESKRCGVCGDRNLKVKKVDEVNGNDVYGYRFSPPFPEKKKEDIILKDDYWNQKTYD